MKDSWRDMAHWAAGQLEVRFGEAVQVKYHDLFDGDCPPMPPEAQLPLVMVEGEVILSGGKIALRVIRRKIETILELEAA